MESSKSIGTIQGMKIEAGTPAGAAYVSKVTHPPTAMPSDYQGRPDCSQSNVVLMEVKSEMNISPILTLPVNSNSTQTLNPSSILFVQSSGMYVSNYVFYISPTTLSPRSAVQPCSQQSTGNQPAIAQANPPATLNQGYQFGNFARDVACFRSTYKSTTYYLNATNFNNQGTVTTAKFKPSIIHSNNATQYMRLHHHENPKLKTPHNISVSNRNLINALKLAVGANQPDSKQDKIKFRHNKQDDDGYDVVDESRSNDKENLNDYPFSYAFQIWDWGFRSGQDDFSALLNNSSNIYANTFLPSNASEILVMSPKACTRPAKEGAFVVQQQIGEIMEWTEVSESVTTGIADPPGLQLCLVRIYAPEQQIFYYQPLYATNNSNVQHALRACDTPWNNLDWSFTLFEGLTTPSNLSPTMSGVPYITLKTFAGMEMQVNPNSSLVSFQRTLPLPDHDAIAMAVGIMHARPDSLPAAANDLGTIAMTAIKYLPTAVTWLKDLFGSAKQKQVAINKATNFVRPKPKRRNRKPKQKIVKLEKQEIKQVSALNKKMNKLAINVKRNEAPATTLPTYQNMKPLPQRPRRTRPVKK